MGATWKQTGVPCEDLDCDGGWSAVLATLLEDLLHGLHGLAPSAAGISLAIPSPAGDVHFTLHAVVKRMIADGEGLMKGLQWKGPSSLRPCVRHPNVVKKDSKLDEAEASFVQCTCSDHLRFETTVDHSLYAKVDFVMAAAARRQRREITKTTYEELEKAAGFSATPNGLLASDKLRRSEAFSPMGATRYDWVHSALQDGMMSVESFLIVVALESKCGVTMEHLETFCRLPWCVPTAAGSNGRLNLASVAKVFRQSQSSETKLKASCSDMLSAYRILRHYLELHEHPEIAEEKQSFMAACDCLDTTRSRHIVAFVFAAAVRGACHGSSVSKRSCKLRDIAIWTSAFGMSVPCERLVRAVSTSARYDHPCEVWPHEFRQGV